MEGNPDIEFNKKIKLARQCVSLACAVTALIINFMPEIREVKYVAVFAACSIYFLYNASKTQVEEEAVDEEWEGGVDGEGRDETAGEEMPSDQDPAPEEQPETPEALESVS